MPFPVKLYVYDLSNGLARTMSMQLTGRQIDGVWHTSVVAYGKEIFYGQGIDIVAPGKSHHGRPLQIIDMGETEIDEGTFDEYILEMREHYTADKYHLLDFNCNSFTNDCIGFLTGGSIPPFIKDLPSDFLSTPFGAALRPTIDSMFRRPSGYTPAGTPPLAQPAAPNLALASSLLQAVATRASGPAPTTPASTVAAPIHVSTNPASFHSVLGAHRAAVAMFTSATCAPCRMIEPVFEELARAKTKGEGRIAFVKVDMDVGMSGMVGREYEVTATPTFVFFQDQKKVHELKGVNAPELKTQVDLLLYQAFPPHPHASLDLPAVSSISLDPILFSQVPALDTVRDKLASFLDSASSDVLLDKPQVQQNLTRVIFPWLQQRFVTKISSRPSAAVVSAFAQTTSTLIKALPVASLFPLLDTWRLALLDPSIAQTSLPALSGLLSQIHTSTAQAPRATLLTLLRLLSNALGSPVLARSLLASDTQAKSALTGVLVQTLLHSDRLVRTSAASVAFNVGAWVQRGRVARVRGEHVANGMGESEEDGEWEVEIISAVVEALGTEQESEDVVHRLTATLALLVRLSPIYADQLQPLFEVLQVGSMLTGKMAGEGGLQVQKKEVRTLMKEVASKLCSEQL
ncbi:DUF862-domain-containing protein [Auriscalpium vulgare]|uniref:DUF862-domain-containing protein n=1 Tax=Auriscalpium vulgare TaxID=40419 RepID=A0ACB8S497_9AGAM|nr:DUF862-domain-containing protein [Auriscalpium vulgare]